MSIFGIFSRLGKIGAAMEESKQAFDAAEALIRDLLADDKYKAQANKVLREFREARTAIQGVLGK